MITFNDLYDFWRMNKDAKAMKSYRNLLPLFNSSEARLKRRAKYWGCWLRYHRWLKKNNSFFYLFRVMNSTIREHVAFDYLNTKKD